MNLIDTHEFCATCPNCGRCDILDILPRFLNGHPVTFYNCRHCDYSTWQATGFHWSAHIKEERE